MSEAVPGSTPYTPLPKHWLAGTAAVVLWILTLVGAVLDITDGFPRALVVVAAAVTVCATLLAALLWFDTVTRARYAGLTEGVGELARQVEQISVKVPDAESAFDAGRRYTEVTTDRPAADRPGPRAVRDI